MTPPIPDWPTMLLCTPLSLPNQSVQPDDKPFEAYQKIVLILCDPHIVQNTELAIVPTQSVSTQLI